MFLNLLNDNQKNLFLDLAIKAAEANGIVEIEEKNMLKAYAIEMQIPARYESVMSTEEILDKLDLMTTQREKKILAFELIGLMFSDGTYDSQERKFMERISERTHIPMNEIDEMIKTLQKYEAVYNEICSLIIN